jgi:glucose/arabinose dehydrogenase
MRARTAALVAATAVSAGGIVSVAMAQSGGPPPPPTSTNGHQVTQVAAGLSTPTSFAFGAGTVFAGDGGSSDESSSGPPNGGVFALKNGTATKLPGSPQFVAGLAWRKGTLYVSGGNVTGPTSAKWQLFAWSGWNGTTFTKQKAIYTAPKKFQGFNGLAFGPDGRLYVGVDVGLLNGNDHGPAKTPYVYDILSLKPNGHGLKVFASGIRQPWQFAFPGHSRKPFVSDLGQDSGATNPPDFVLRVKKGDNYGFPHCNWTSKKRCKGYAKPFKTFGPHTDIMGLAIIGKRLYMTSFTGQDGKGPGGEVLSMTLKGKDVKPVLTGFVAPTVGLGAHDGTLYVGELTGQVFSVKP